MEKEKMYLGHIESLRAIAALMVMIFHFVSFQHPNGPLIASESIRMYSEFGAQGVELFYIISGFVIYYSLTKVSLSGGQEGFGFKQYPKYLLKRVLRIFPPFWGVILLSCTIPFMWGWPFPYTVKELLQNATLTVDLFREYNWMNLIFITLKVEFLFYLVIGLVAVLMKKTSWSYALITFGSLLGTYYYHSFDLVHNIPFFLIGIACCQVYQSRDLILNYCLLAACIIFLYFVFPMEDVIISVIGIVFLLWIPIKNHWFEFIGKFSYSVYLTHGFSGGMFLFYCKSKTSMAWSPWVYFALAVCCSIVFAYCYYLISEKYAIKWSKSIRY